MRDAAVGRVRRLADDFESRGDFATEADLRALLAERDALTARVAKLEAEAAGNDYLMGEAAMGAQEAETQHRMQVDALTAEVAALRADRDRLDWLEARVRKDRSVEVGWSSPGFESDEYGGNRSWWPGGYYAVACDADGLYDHESLRAALDAAKEGA